jgi:hypothetical protein
MKDEAVLESPHSALSQQPGIVNNQRNLIWRFRCTPPLCSAMARPSTCRVRSHDAAMYCGASIAVFEPRRRPQKMAENGGFGDDFEHLFTGVNGVGKRRWCIRNSSSAIPIVAHLCSPQDPSDDTRDVVESAVQRFLITPILIIHHKTGCRSRQKTRYRLISQRTNGLRDHGIPFRRNGFTPTRPVSTRAARFGYRGCYAAGKSRRKRGGTPGPQRDGEGV